MSARFERVAIVGVGLIGASFALALKAARGRTSVVGVGRSRENLERARAIGAIDEIAADAASAVQDADLLLLATPVGQIAAILGALAPRLAARTVITDAGSTKRDVVAAARGALGARVAQFVPGHPIAGAEASGAAAARADLYRGKRVVLTPLAENPPETVARVEAVWTACGARVSRMGAEAHDAVFAAVSHLPHLLAFGLVHEFAARENAAQLFDYAAGGFRDFTRIASSHPEMWRDICLANRDALLAECARYQGTLDALRRLLENGDGAGLERVFAEARAARDAWLRSAGAASGETP